MDNEEKLKKPEYELVKVYLQGQGVYHVHFQSLFYSNNKVECLILQLIQQLKFKLSPTPLGDKKTCFNLHAVVWEVSSLLTA